jgi:hypothetical protein
MVIAISRILKHALTPRWLVRRVFPSNDLAAVEAAIRDTELLHEGEIRFAVEGGLDLPALLDGVTARERAVEVFSRLRVWDTEYNSGVLVYLLLADRQVEIVADRGIHARVGAEAWEGICRRMEQAFRDGRFAEGVVTGIREIGDLLARHFPPRGANPNELPDRPEIL